MKPFHFHLGYRNDRFFPIQILIFLMLDNNAVLIFRAWATFVLTYTYPIHGIHAWWKGVVKSKMAVTDRKY